MITRNIALLLALTLACAAQIAIAAEDNSAARRKVAVTDDIEPSKAETARMRKIAAKLEAEGSAASLSTAALARLATQKDKPKALALLDSAASLAPTDPAIAWLRTNVCAQIDGCDVTDRAARLIDLDGGNAAAHYPALSRARLEKNVDAENQALNAMARSGYFDVYWSGTLLRTIDSLTTTPLGRSKKPLLELDGALGVAINWSVVAALPMFKEVSDTCKKDRLGSDDVRAACLRLAEVFENGDTYIAQAIGRSIAKRLYSVGDPQLAQIEQRQRQYSYESQTIQPHAEEILTSDEGVRAWLNRYRANRRESDFYRAWLVELGLPVEAPADFGIKSPK
jgi:hypothetical protein